MKHSIRPLPHLPDCDDTLRRLADVLQIPLTCRRRACRAGRCKGGYGPPCYLEQRLEFTKGVHEQMHEYREFWKARRDSLLSGPDEEDDAED
ncbi:hypothetical protein [Microvirga roseola]|uniref:hypothetical protein n=1 Tax=Microvirga roseola TaxID=2883126 RepID=UPI001E41A92A|nr:hypothetical protein [Microvirga roseola]